MTRRSTSPDATTSSAWRDPVVIAATAAALLQIAIVWLPNIPLGIPGEWTWPRIDYAAGDYAALFLGVLSAAPVAAAYLVFCRIGDARLSLGPERRFKGGWGVGEHATSRGLAASGAEFAGSDGSSAPVLMLSEAARVEERPSHPQSRRSGQTLRAAARRWPWLLGLTVSGFAWLWVVQEAAPQDLYRLGRGPVVMHFPAFSGYFTEARKVDDLPRYLSGYEALMAEGDVLHIGTHPPGLIMLHRVLIETFRGSPTLTNATLALRPASARNTGEMLATLPVRPEDALSDAEQAELWAATLGVQLFAAAAVIPLFVLTERSFGTTPAWRAACLWPLVPAVAVFLPKSDAMFPAIGLTVLALWHRSSPPGVVRAIVAGAVFWFGLMLSLAMLPVALLAGVLTMQQLAAAPASERNRIVRMLLVAIASAAAAFVVLTLVTWLLFDLNLPAVWSWNYRNHAGFYEQYVRTYWKWLLGNPIELAMAVGLPIVAATVASRRDLAFAIRSPLLPVLGTIGLLWVTGKNAGEAARLWLFLMPWLLWCTASIWNGDGGGRRWRAVLVLQLATGFLTAVRVSGFGFAEMVGAVR